MRPIEFEVNKIISESPTEICEKIADVNSWSDFDGYGVLPGIEKAEYEKRTVEMTGSRIRVQNSDGSEHIEEILEWETGKKIVMKLHEFPTALSYLATHFIEHWKFEELNEGETRISRKFQMFPTSFVTRPLLSQIASLMKRATEKHLDEMQKKGAAE